MDEVHYRILLGILRRESLQEIANDLRLSVSVVHDKMTWLRDQGYIRPWEPHKSRCKELTETGRLVVRRQYGEAVFQI